MPTEPSPVVPDALRLRTVRARWRLAHEHARSTGTPLARSLAPWRWTSALTLCLGLSMAPVAAVRTAALVPQPVSVHRTPAWYVVRDLALAVVVLVSVVALGVPVEQLAAMLVPVALVALVWAVENAHMLRTARASLGALRLAVGAIAASGHLGPVLVCEGLAGGEPDDIAELSRRWLAHVDASGIALVAAADDAVARTWVAGLTPASRDSDRPYRVRLPRPPVAPPPE